MNVYLAKEKGTEALMDYLVSSGIAERCDVEDLKYEGDEYGETVEITYKGGSIKRINVTWNSMLAITHEVIEALY